MFRVEEYAKQVASDKQNSVWCLIVVGCLLGFLFDPEEGMNTFLWNDYEVPSD
jgi:hypothetical protein